jgi:hypothetical protein
MGQSLGADGSVKTHNTPGIGVRKTVSIACGIIFSIASKISFLIVPSIRLRSSEIIGQSFRNGNGFVLDWASFWSASRPFIASQSPRNTPAINPAPYIPNAKITISARVIGQSLGGAVGSVSPF